MDLVTGATGLLGSHIAEQLIQRGRAVRALVRPQSDTRFLQSLNVQLKLGDLNDPASLRQSMAGVEHVYHAAARVGDWGRWSEFQSDAIEGTRSLVDACLSQRVKRLIHVSSTSAYGHPKPGPEPVTEEHPLGTRFWLWDYYTRAKIEAEKIVWKTHEQSGLPVTVIRPSWIYGPRDRTSIFRLARKLAQGMVLIVDNGENRLSSVYAGNVAEACILAAENPAALGQAYNIASDGPITQREYVNLFADALGAQRPKWRVPYWLAYGGAFKLESIGRLLQLRRPLWATRYAVWLLGRSTSYSSAKAEHELGWQPSVGYAEGVRRTVEWYRQQIGA